jgi:hypothetical protein
MPTVPSFVTPMFLKDDVWYRQLADEKQVTGFEPVLPDNVPEISRANFEEDISVDINDRVVYGFVVSDKLVYFGVRQNLSRALMQLSPSLVGRRHLYAKVYDFVFDEPPPPDQSLSRKSWSSTLIHRDRIERTRVIEAPLPGELIREEPYQYARVVDFFDKSVGSGEPLCIVAGGIEGEAILEGLTQVVPRIQKERCFFASESEDRNSKDSFSKLVGRARRKFGAAGLFVCLSNRHPSASRISTAKNIFPQAALRLSPGFMDWQAERGGRIGLEAGRSSSVLTGAGDWLGSFNKDNGPLH